MSDRLISSLDAVHALLNQRHHNAAVNLPISRTFVGLNLAVCAAWNYAEGGPVYHVYQAVLGNLKLARSSLNQTPQRVNHYLIKYFALISGRAPGLDLLGHAISHKAVEHLLKNVATFWTFQRILAPSIPPAEYVALMLVSAMTAGLAQSQLGGPPAVRLPRGSRSRRQVVSLSLGASGITSCLSVVGTCLAPEATAVSAIIPFPMPLWAVTLASQVWDFYFMNSVSDVGHAAHLGGALTGFLYYWAWGRRYGTFGSL